MKLRSRFCPIGMLGLILLATIAGTASAKMRIAVLEFQNNATEAKEITEGVRRGITDMLTTELVKTGAFTVYERSRIEAVAKEQKLSASGLVDPTTAVSLGRLVGVEAIVTGAITEFSTKTSGGFIPLGGFTGVAVGSSTAKVALDLRVVRVQTGEVVSVVRETGTADRSAGGVMISGLAFGEGESGGILSAATYNAIQKIANRLRQMVSGSSYHVLAYAGDMATVDAGMSQGIQPGQMLAVYLEGTPVVGLKGEILGIEKNYLAILKAKDVQNAYSKCEVVRMEGTPSRGDLVELFFGKPDQVPLKRRSTATALNALGGGSGGTPPAVEPTPDPRQEPTPVPASTGKGKKGATPTPEPVRPTLEPTPAPHPTQAPVNLLAGSASNKSDQIDVLDAMPLTPEQKANITIVHKGGYYNLTKGNFSRALKQFEEGVKIYSGNYLDMYWAGVTAYKMGKKPLAREWIDKAIAANPSYEPAIDFRDRNLAKKK